MVGFTSLTFNSIPRTELIYDEDEERSYYYCPYCCGDSSLMWFIHIFLELSANKSLNNEEEYEDNEEEEDITPNIMDAQYNKSELAKILPSLTVLTQPRVIVKLPGISLSPVDANEAKKVRLIYVVL